jgi:hypothetical protein
MNEVGCLGAKSAAAAEAVEVLGTCFTSSLLARLSKCCNRFALQLELCDARFQEINAAHEVTPQQSIAVRKHHLRVCELSHSIMHSQRPRSQSPELQHASDATAELGRMVCARTLLGGFDARFPAQPKQR